jgi:exopolysaccharide biosynthesis polyprenyl glycosylphosphotransferase
VAFLAAFTLLAGTVGALTLLLSFSIRVGSPRCGGRTCPSLEPWIPVFLVAGVTRGVLYLVHRHDRHRRKKGYFDEIVEAFSQATVGSLAIVLFAFWHEGGRHVVYSYDRSVFFLDWVLAVVGMSVVLTVNKFALMALRRRGHNLKNIVIVGDSPTSKSFIDAVSAHRETGYRIVGQLDDGRETGADFVEELVKLSADKDVDQIVLATSAIDRGDITRVVSLSALRRIEVRAVPDLFGLAPTKVQLETAGDFPLLSLLNEPRPGARRAVKRALDVVVGTASLVAAGPILGVAALGVRLTSPGPILFGQERIGMDGRPFDMLKFRTMYREAETSMHEEYVTDLLQGRVSVIHEQDGLYKLVDDPRITRWGRVLRRLSVDELPQLFNVLKGDMSLVGPRPALPFEVALYRDWQRRRLDVRPGMTGLWQVSGRNRLTFDDMFRLDLQYIEMWSPLQDVRIILRTIPAILRKEAS